MFTFCVWPLATSMPGHVQREGHVLRILQVVMRDNSQSNFVAHAEEARGGQADDQILAREHPRHHTASLAVVGHGADGGAPGSERIGEAELDLGAPIRAGADIGIPVSGIRKGLAHLGNHQVRAGLDLRHPRMKLRHRQLRQQRRLGARLTGEKEIEGGLRFELRLALRVEEVNDVAALIGTHGVKRFIYLAEAEVGLNGLARAVECEHVEAALLAGKILGLGGRGRHCEGTFHQRNFQALVRGIYLIIADEERIDY